MKKIAIASDHAGFRLKTVIKNRLTEKGFEVIDFGTHSEESCDYPDYAHPAAVSVASGKCDMGIAICFTGNGMQMTLNKYSKIRAALCWLPRLAELARQHNDANFLVMPAGFIDEDTALKITDAFFEAEFEGGRHLRRVNKISSTISLEGEVV